ncbi:hypothetical protein HYW68_00260 [Candidatus Parcubacteria bacterium]|nr:hypothetical protein [Candidatus Parcubacteria bacterium]
MRRERILSLILLGVTALSIRAASAQETTVGDLLDRNATPQARESVEQELHEQGIDPADAAKTTIDYDASANMIVVTAPEGTNLDEQQLFFIGARVGALVPLGIEGTVLDVGGGRKVYNLSLGLTTSYDMHTIEAGGGWHPRGRAFYVGGRMKDVIMHDTKNGYGGLFDSKRSDHFFGISPEVGWIKVWGKNQRVMGSISLGATKAWGADYNLPVMADIRFGIAVRFLKKQ